MITQIDNQAWSKELVTGNAQFIELPPSTITNEEGTASGGTTPVLTVKYAGAFLSDNGVQYVNTYFVTGSVTSGTFVDYETVIQTTTGAGGYLVGTVTGSSSMIVSNIYGAPPDSTDTWVGQTSGAVFTPTAVPINQPLTFVQSSPAQGQYTVSEGTYAFNSLDAYAATLVSYTTYSVMYLVSQVREDNTFAVFKSESTPPQPGVGYAFDSKATYTFATINGKNNTSFDPSMAYDASTQTIYIVGTQDNVEETTDVLLFAYNTTTDTLGSPITLVTASYVRDSYDICIISGGAQFVAVAITDPVKIWNTTAKAAITNISISGGVLKAYGSVGFSTNQDVTFSALQNALFLNGTSVQVTGVGTDGGGTYFTANYVTSPPTTYTQVGYENGFATWLPGHTLLGFIVGSSTVYGTTVLDSSPFRSGNTFGAVSTYSPDGNSIETYYESHPKQVTFADQTFSLNLSLYNGASWLPSTSLYTFAARYSDSRLTVIPSGSTRVLLQQYYSQMVHQNALVGNLLVGYYDGGNWRFHLERGSLTTSYTQGTLSVSETQGSFISYLAEPVYSIKGGWSPVVKTYKVNDRVTYSAIDYIVNQSVTYNYRGSWTLGTTYNVGDVVVVGSVYYTAINPIFESKIPPTTDTTDWVFVLTPNLDSRFTVAPTAWPLHAASLNLTTFNMTDVPGYYNNLNFTWLRGSKSVLDDLTQWAVVGEIAGSTTSGATYVSNFLVPPVVKLVPDGYTTTILRGTPLLLDASGTNDGDVEPIQFTWTMNSTNPNIHLTPNSSGTQATLLVDREIGGSVLPQPLLVGVVAVDYSGSTPLHPPMNVNNIAVTGNILTVGVTATPTLAPTEVVFLYDIGTATFLNDRRVEVLSVGSSSFTASFMDGYTSVDYASTADTGHAIGNYQFDFCAVNIPINLPPAIDFTHDAVTHALVTVPIETNRNSTVIIRPTYTGVTDADDITTYTWSQISGTTLPATQILSGLTSPTLEFTTDGVLIEGESVVWSLIVADGVNYPATGTVQVNVASYPFVYTDSLRISRSIWGPPPSVITQSSTFSTYFQEPITNVLSFNQETTAGSLILIFESNNEGVGSVLTFGTQPTTTAATGTDWQLKYVPSSTSDITVSGFKQVAGTGVVQNPDWLVAEVNGQFTAFDQSVVASSGSTATLTTTQAAGCAALVVATVKVTGGGTETMTGAPPTGWDILLYHQYGQNGGAWAGVFYQVVTTPSTTLNFVWPSLPSGYSYEQVSLTAFNTTSPFVLRSINAPISLRNTPNPPSPLDATAFFSNFSGAKRNSVLDGSDRYLLISDASVTVYGGIHPALLLLRRLFLPIITRNISSLSRTSGVVTLHLASGITNSQGMYFNVQNISDPTYEGVFPATYVNPTTFTYAAAGVDGNPYLPVNSGLFQEANYSTYYIEPPRSTLSLSSMSTSGSLILEFESNNEGVGSSKTFGAHTTTVANSGTNWEFSYILNSTPANTASGYVRVAGTDVNQVPDWLLAEFSGQFNTYDHTVKDTSGVGTSLTTTQLVDCAALVIATVKVHNGIYGLMAGNPPTGWTPLVYNTGGGGAWSGVFYKIVTTPTTLNFVWPSLVGAPSVETSLTAFNTSTPYVTTEGSQGGFISTTRKIVDAVHTESDYTLVLDNSSTLYCFTTAPVFNTDNPDVAIDLTNISSQTFNKMFSTTSFNNSRVVVLTGEGGCLFLQVRSSDLQVQGSLEFTVSSGLLYGVDNVQFIRTSNVENLKVGKVLIGTIAEIVADVSSVNVSNNVVTVVADNTFSPRDIVEFADLTNATFLNGVVAPVVSATPTQFVIGYQYGNYATTSEPAGATATIHGKAYETLVDLSQGRIIGTWDASKLRNQHPTTGEILFEPDDTYAGKPSAPTLSPINGIGVLSSGFVGVQISWVADRPDLIQTYNLESSLDGVNWTTNVVNSGAIQTVTLPEPVGQLFYFRIQAVSADGVSPYSNIQIYHT